MDLETFAGKTVIVTGAARGIGAKTAEYFSRAGAKLVLNDIDDNALSTNAKQLAKPFLLCPGDIADPSTVERLFECAAEFGGVDILVNNAGLTETYKPFLETSLEDWDKILNVNLRAAFLTSHAAATYWAKQGKPGCIVNVSSPGAARAHHDNSIYVTSKGGLEALTRALAVDLGPYNIRVNAVAPAAVNDAVKEQPALPLGRGASTADVAASIAFLGSSDAGAITGHVLAVDGGLLAQLRTPHTDAS